MKSKKYYIIGIGGVAMASLAGLLKQRGHEVAGSDQEMYEPMKGMLKSLKVKVLSPYNSFHMKPFDKAQGKRYTPDVIVVGNAIKKDNPKLAYLFSIGQCRNGCIDCVDFRICWTGSYCICGGLAPSFIEKFQARQGSLCSN